MDRQKELLLRMQQLLQDQSQRNEIYQTYRDFTGRYAILVGGSGSGKSYEVADKTIDRIAKEDGHRILCVRAQRNQVTESQFPLLESRIKKRYNIDNYKVNRAAGSEQITCLKNSNQILFAGLDDVEKLKSIFDITSVWIEEADQTSFDDLKELDRRLRGYEGKNSNRTEKYMQITLSFNPVSILSWLKLNFFDKQQPGQIMLHGKKMFPFCKYWKDVKINDLNVKEKVWDAELEKEVERNIHNILIIHSTYLDNKHIDSVYHQIMNKLKEDDPEEYEVYGNGMWGVTGGTYFDKKKVNERIQANIKPLKVGFFEYEYVNEKIVDETIKFVEDENGYVKLYELPMQGYPYVCGGDTAGEGSDNNIGCLTNNITKEDAATLKIDFDEDLYARQMYCLGKYYGSLNGCNNDALIAIETNFSTHPVKELIRLEYMFQYVREEKPDSMTGKTKKVYGYNTNQATRPTALGMLKAELREYPERFKDLELLLEMTTFVKNERGRPEAIKGAHDDYVMARAINCYTRHQGYDGIKVPEPKPKKKLIEVMGIDKNDYIRR